MRLATDRTLLDEVRRDLWAIVDARLWFVEVVVKDYQAELALIEPELENELSRA